MGSNIRKGSVLVICATVCWGLISPLAKIISAADIDLMTLMVFRSLFTIAVSLLCLFLVGSPARLRVDRETLCFYFLCGFFSIALAGGCYLKSLSYLTVAQALVIHYTSPLVTLAGSMWITREKPTLLHAAAGVIIVAGVFAGMGGSLTAFSSVSAAGVIWAALSVIGLSGQTLVGRRFSISHETDRFAMLLYSSISGCILLFAYKTIFTGWADVRLITPRIFSLMCFVGFTGSFLAYGLFYASLKYIPAAAVNLFSTFEIVVAVGLTALLVGQIPSGYEILGCALIMTAIFCAYIATEKKK